MAQLPDYVSVIATSLLQPIVALIEGLESTPATPPNEVQTGPRENGYACSIVVLSVIALEAIANRVRFLNGHNPKDERNIPKYLSKIIAEPGLAEVQAVMSVRDAIVHNHLWTAKVRSNQKGDLVFDAEPILSRDEYGDNKFWDVMDPSTRQTRSLQINLFPARIWRADAYKVLRVVIRAMKSLQAVDNQYVNIDIQIVEYREQVMTIDEVMHSLLP